MSPDSRENSVISDTPCACVGVCPMWLYKRWSLEKGPPGLVELSSCDTTHQWTPALYVTWQVCFECVCVRTCAIPEVSAFLLSLANELTEQVKSNIASQITNTFSVFKLLYNPSKGLKCTVAFCCFQINDLSSPRNKNQKKFTNQNTPPQYKWCLIRHHY